MAEHRIWFDCDTGVDDAIALLTAHRQPGLEIVGLSTVAGNVTLDHTTENTLKICGLMGADYPVYPGAPGPLRREREDASSFHGADGLGGAVLPAPRRAPEQMPAWDALYEAAARMPGELTLVETGPLTNAAIALTAHPLFRAARSLYAYLSYNQEVRTLPLIRQAQALGKRVAVPKVYGETDMRFLWLDDPSRIAPGAFGIPEPVDDGPEADDPAALVLMPGLAFDPQGHRLGYGGGFYDRFLAAEPHPTIALCYAFQLLPQLETEAHDIPVDAVLSAPV